MLAVFRADASLHIGNGHVMRCLTLANALAERDYTCLFVCRDMPGHFGEYLRSFGHEVCLLPGGREDFVVQAEDPPHAAWLGVDWQTDAEQTLVALAGRHATCLVVDHYALDARWENALRPHCAQLLVLDDLADRAHDCDVLLDQTLGRKPEDYAAKVPAVCAVLAGAEYALLRPDFSALRKASLARRAVGNLAHVLVSMGGVDAGNATGQVLSALCASELPSDCRITVVLGANAPCLNEVRAQAEHMPWATTVRVGVADMAELMADCDLAIGAAGSSAWERCCLGLPSVMVVLAENQRDVAAALCASGAAFLLGECAEIAARLPAMLASLVDAEALQKMTVQAGRVTDGRGVARLLARLPGETV